MGVILAAVLLYIYLFVCTQRTAEKLRNPFFVNTPGCRIVAMDVMNPIIEKYTVWEWNHPKFHLKCLDVNWFQTELVNGDWYVKLVPDIEAILEDSNLSFDWEIHCSMWDYRSTGNLVNTLTNRRKFDLEYPYALRMPKGVKQLRVKCISSLTNATLYDDALYFIQPPPQVLLPVPPPTLRYWEKGRNTKGTAPPISVMVVGLDSISHLNLIRQMSKTTAYVRQKTSQVEFWGYNKVGVNTYPNLIPMLTGLSEAEAGKYWSKKTNMDGLPYIWKDFKEAGYNTSFGEDWPHYSMFYYNKPGFARQPTDYSFHDLMLQLHMQRKPSTMSDTSCAGGRILVDALMEVTCKLLPHKQRYPFFSFYWWADGLHEFLNTPRLVDARFEQYLRRLNDAGIMNNTVIFFMSDHGLRWGRFRRTFQGMIEDCQPFLSVLYPPWMRKKYPMAIRNLAGNARSLVTTFDLHETFKHLLHLNTLEDEHIAGLTEELSKRNASQIPRAVSLFLPIPPERTCNTSHIPSRFCLCHKQVAISVDNSIVKLSANIIVNSINKLLEEYPVCMPLQLDSIVSAHFAAPERQNDYYIEKGHHNHAYSEKSPYYAMEYTDKDIVVRLQTNPGEAYFEGMTRMHRKVLYLIGDVVRVGGNASKDNDCIQNALLEPFCYCAV